MSDTFQTASPVKSTSVRDYITAPENSESFHEEHKVGDQWLFGTRLWMGEKAAMA